MKSNFERFNEIMYVDCSLKHKQGANAIEMTLVLLSGINNEGKNVLFGFGLLKEPDKDSYKWLMK
jgi:hypothetical protein